MSSTNTRVEVHVDLPNATARAGTAFISRRRQALTTTFTYDSSYLDRADAIEISPDLRLDRGPSVVDGLPGAFRDSAPDRWGRNLIAKRIRGRASAERRTPPAVDDLDYLLGVSDLTRQGALRFAVGNDPTFVEPGLEVPKLVELPRLLRAADLIDRDTAHNDELAVVKELLDAGSGSLGGARPKASVRDGDVLYIAKFPHQHDDWNVIAWEKTALDLAEAVGIDTPPRRLVDVGGRPVLLVERFDRHFGTRVPYVSAMSLLQGSDGDQRDYLEVAEELSSRGSAVGADLRQLWLRIVFSVNINNTDDHLRNHGFLHRNGGWRLAPTFDVNPNPVSGARRATTINFVDDREACRTAALDTCAHFGVTPSDARHLAQKVAEAVATWRSVARANGIPDRELERFEHAFES